MLTVLARQHPVKITRRQLATLAKLKVTGGTFGTYFGDLRHNGLISEEGGFVVLTEARFACTGASPELPVTADELRRPVVHDIRMHAIQFVPFIPFT